MGPHMHDSYESLRGDSVSRDQQPVAQVNDVARTRQKRRNRLITSCLECRRRKLKCDTLQPCKQCSRLKKDCVFSSNPVPVSIAKAATSSQNGGALQSKGSSAMSASNISGQLSQQDAAIRHPSEGISSAETFHLHSLKLLSEYDEAPEISPMASLDATYNENTFGNDLVDFGIIHGKSHLTERLGGLFRPSLAEEVKATISDMDKKAISQGRSLYPPLEIGLSLTVNDFDFGYDSRHHKSGLMFGFGADFNADLTTYLPTRLAADKLISEYFTKVNSIACAVHRPSLEKGYQEFWHNMSVGIEVSKPLQALCFAVMFSGLISMDEVTVERDFGVSKDVFVEKLQAGTELALREAEFMRTTKFVTVQALVIYLIPQCRSEVSRSHSVLVGAVLRLAECLGLHRDGTSIGLDPLETHVRRLVWHQICFLDIRTCEAQGPMPGVRREDYNTLFPLNVDDQDLHATGKAPENQLRWTDATFSLIRFECLEMLRLVWFERRKLYTSTKTLTTVLRKIKDFQDYMAEKYDHLMDDRVPIQHCAKLMKAIMMSRYHVIMLFPFYGSVVQSLPDDRLRDVLIESGTRNQEAAVALDTVPDVSPWKWYSGAYNQYTTTFLLLTEVYKFPERKQADRIWKCVDYVYDLDLELPRDVKARSTMMALQRKIAAYQIIRGVRATPTMTQGNQTGQGSDNQTKRATDSNRKSIDGAAGVAIDYDNGIIAMSAIGRSNTKSVGTEGFASSFQQSQMSQTRANQDAFNYIAAAAEKQDHMDLVQSDLFKDIDWAEWDELFPPSFDNEGFDNMSFV